MTHGPRESAPKAQESSLMPLGIQRRQVEVTVGCLEVSVLILPLQSPIRPTRN